MTALAHGLADLSPPKRTKSPCRVLVVHNAYQHRGGEDSVVDAEIALLQSYGHVVETYFRTNDEVANLSELTLARHTLWSPRTRADLASLIKRFRPDVIHAHNTFPLVSPSLYWAAARARIPVVQTLHNFRLMCLNGLFLRKEKVCEDCMGAVPWRGVARGCYRGSHVASTALAGMLTFHRGAGTWQKKVTRYIALNEFCRGKFIEAGLPAERIAVKPNFADFEAPAAATRAGFLFVGRLSAEKGIDVLVGAAMAVGAANIRVAGSGPEAASLENIQGITALGSLSGDQVRSEMSRATALVLPSICYENFPRTLVEAFGCGLPVIASRIGALAELVSDGLTGLLFEPGNPSDLASKMAWAQSHPEAMAEMGCNARRLYEREYTAERNHQQLVAIYRDAINSINCETTI
jgi:glycosyltransferase involved in cell wall biosynthesis